MYTNDGATQCVAPNARFVAGLEDNSYTRHTRHDGIVRGRQAGHGGRLPPQRRDVRNRQGRQYGQSPRHHRRAIRATADPPEIEVGNPPLLSTRMTSSTWAAGAIRQNSLSKSGRSLEGVVMFQSGDAMIGAIKAKHDSMFRGRAITVRRRRNKRNNKDNCKPLLPSSAFPTVHPGVPHQAMGQIQHSWR